MAKVTIEFKLKNGDRVTTSNEKIIKQLIEQNAQYTVLEGNINDVVKSQNTQAQSTDNLTKSYKDILREYKEAEKELRALAISGDTTSARYQELSQSVGAARAALEDVNKEANINKGAFDAVIGSASGLANGFTAVQGALGLFGAESEEVEKALLRVQSALALSTGLDEFLKAIPAFGNLSKIVKGPLVAAFTTLKGAIIATGIGAAVVAVGLLIANFDKVKKVILGLFPGLETLGKFFGNLFQNITDFVGLTSEAERAAERLNRLSQERIAISNRELEILQARGASEEEIANAQRAQTEQRIADLNKLAELNGELTEEELNERTDLVQKLQVLNVEAAKRRQDQAKANEERLTNTRRVNTQRRVELLENGLNKELQTLRLNYEQQRKEAIKNGEDISLVDQLFIKQRLDLVKKFNDDYNKFVNDFYKDFAQLSGEGYVLEEIEFRTTLQNRLETLNDFQKQQLSQLKEGSDEYLKLAQQQAIEFRFAVITSDRLLAEFRRKAIADGYTTLISLEKELAGDRLEEIKKANGISETLLELETDGFRKEFEERKRIQQKALLDATQADAAAKFDRISNVKDVSELTKQSDIDLFNFIQQNQDNLTNVREAFINSETDRVKKYYQDLANLSQENFENELRYNNELKKLNDGLFDDEINNEIARLKELNSITTTDLVQRKAQERAINAKFDAEETERQRFALQTRLQLAKDTFGEQSEEYKKLLLELEKFENDQINKQTQRREQQLATFTQLFQQFLTTLSEIGAAIDSFYELQSQRTNKFYDDEVKKNEDARNTEVNNFALSQEEIANINQRYALEEAQIEEERAAKIKAIEKRRADTAFKLQIAQILGNGALAITRAFAELGPVAGAIASILVGGTTAAQLAVARNQQQVVRELGDGGFITGPSHSQGGIPIPGTGVEVEGGEFVVNKRSTAAFLPMLQAINSTGVRRPSYAGTMANGGIMGMMNNQIPIIKTYLVSSDVASDQAKLARIKRNSLY